MRVTTRSLECFTHGLAHLIDELGPDEALELAGRIVLLLAKAEPDQWSDILGRDVVLAGGER